MSFMYNPYPYDDPRAVNRPALAKKTVEAVVGGTPKAAAALAAGVMDRLKAAPGKNVVVAFDGYATADWTRMVNLLSQQLIGKGIDVEAFPFAEVFKSEQEIADIIDPNLEWDTTKDPFAAVRTPDQAEFRRFLRYPEGGCIQVAPGGAESSRGERPRADCLRKRMPGEGAARAVRCEMLF